MYTPSPEMFYEDWAHPCYDVKVRGTTYLWGSAGLTANFSYDKPLLLHIRNHTFGEAIVLGTRVASGSHTALGTLQPGECISISVQGISGVFATAQPESTVSCLIK